MSSPSPPTEGPAEAPKYEVPKPPPKQNPAFRMIGMPNFRFKLPSRNWLIFLSITGSFAAAITYDRYKKRAAQKKWCDLVAHISQQPLPVNQMPRKLTIFLSAPPGDGIRPSREYFKEYIKPILVAAAMDYDVIEGRKEGDVRYGTAEQIRRLRRKKGEKGEAANEEEEMDPETLVEKAREQLKIRPEPGIRGDLVIGRHTWKEYIRGLHEGWLGPLDQPKPPPQDLTPAEPIPPPPPSDDASPSSTAHTQSEKPAEAQKPQEQEKKPPFPPPAYIPTTSYASSPLSPHIPTHLDPSSPIPHTHILGFLNTPIRIYRYLTQRHLVDSIGRETAAIVLAFNRPYHESSDFATSTTGADLDASPLATRAPENDAAPAPVQTSQTWEQQSLLQEEESNWHKSARKPRDDDLERVWLDDVVMDPRIAPRMRRFELAPEEEERARRIGGGVEKGRAHEIQDLRRENVVVEKFE